MDSSTLLFCIAEIAFVLASLDFHRQRPLTDEGREITEYTGGGKNPDDKLQKCHVLEPENSSRKRDWKPLSGTDCRRLTGQHTANHYATRCPSGPTLFGHALPEIL